MMAKPVLLLAIIDGIEGHMEADGVWHLQYPGETFSKGHTPSKAWLKENVEFARLRSVGIEIRQH